MDVGRRRRGRRLRRARTCCTSCGARLDGAGLRGRAGVGGTWYWNRYPGARCDVESMEYSYQFAEELQQEWDWTERYADPARDPAVPRPRRRPVRPAAPTSSSTPGSTTATFDEATARWTVRDRRRRRRDRRGSSSWRRVACRRRTSPTSPGVDRSTGDTYHTGRWPHEGVDFTGKRVGVIGTGLVGDPGDPDHRRGGRELTCSSARRATRCRPATRRSTRRSRRRSRPTTPGSAPATARWPPASGRAVEPGEPSALAVDAEERDARVRGALGATAASRSSARSPTC